ncbi:hypothetical protein OESDEN_02260 [Oesophagostomum dentatum]|uniref:7TM GPCR serpentine receptor class x (Srx) domain-containing protein n=1 Tax=Oesophagostomum dentatum TaxID=61180 RepID=A0A0B1TKI8_OESDE|nr:hypothetical protein OESDEN_02260 [Oesophagostomum dentatum]
MLTAFSVGYLVDGIAYLLAGILRLRYLYENTYYTSTTSLECLTKNLYPILLVLGGQLKSIFP